MTAEQQIFELARWILAAVTLWWVAGAALWLGALASDRVWLGRMAATVALPGTRRIAQAILAVGLSALPACSPDRATPSLVYLGDSPPTTTTAAPATASTTATPAPATAAPTTPAPTTHPATSQLPGDDPPIDQAANTEPAAATNHHEVIIGDHLWGIAAQHLSSGGDSPTNEAIAHHWRRVIIANAATIRSGDPDLIYPGEILTLPPLP